MRRSYRPSLLLGYFSGVVDAAECLGSSHRANISYITIHSSLDPQLAAQSSSSLLTLLPAHPARVGQLSAV